MASIEQKISLVDKVSPNLTKIQQNALKLVAEYEKLDKQQQEVFKQMELLANAGHKDSDTFKNLNQVYYELESKMQDIANGNFQIKDSQDQVNVSAIELNQSLEVLNKAWSALSQVVQMAYGWMEKSNEQFNAEYTAAVKMHNALGASNDQIQSMYDYAGALQKVGVVGDEATIAGMSELTLYTETLDQVKQLTPAILDMAVAEHGLNVSQSNVQSTASMVGRALNGQARMLRTHLGLTEAEVKALDKMTDKEKKTAKLLELMERKTKGANKALAKTAQGGLLQARNRMSDMAQLLGEKVTPYISAFETAVADLLEPAVQWIADNMDVIAPIFLGVAGAIGVVIVALTLLTIKNAIAGASWLASLGPILLVVAAIGLVVAGILWWVKETDKLTGQTHSSLGIITGMLFTFVAIVYDAVIVPIYNGIATLANFLNNVFKNPLETIQIMFLDMGEAVLNVILSIANGLDSIFGTELSSGVNHLIATLGWTRDKIAEASSYEEVMPLLESWDVQQAARQGYEFGENLGANIKNGIENSSIFKTLDETLTTDSNGNAALNTTSGDNLLKPEDIQLLLDVATRDFKIDYQNITPEITVTFGDVHETADVEAVTEEIISQLEETFYSDLEVAPSWQ